MHIIILYLFFFHYYLALSSGGAFTEGLSIVSWITTVHWILAHDHNLI